MNERMLLLGDSLIAFFDWQEYFSQMDCINLGVPGETVQGWHLLTGQAATRHPEAEYLVVMLGANNLCQQDYSFIPQYEILLAELCQLYPHAKIVVCSLLPHELSWLGATAISRLNKGLEIMAVGGGCFFLDLQPSFLANGAGCFMADGVHLSEKGYDVWCDALDEWLDLSRHAI